MWDFRGKSWKGGHFGLGCSVDENETWAVYVTRGINYEVGHAENYQYQIFRHLESQHRYYEMPSWGWRKIGGRVFSKELENIDSKL